MRGQIAGPAMLTKFTLLKRRADLTQAEFSQHWRTIHAKVLVEEGGHQRYNRHYVQNHFIHDTALGFCSTEFDGAAQMIPQNATAVTKGFQEDPLYLKVVRPDEDRFLDVARCAVIYCEGRAFHDGPESGGYKLLSLLKRKPDHTREEFISHWRNRHAPLVKSVPEFWRHVRGYTQYYVIPEATRGMAAGEKDIEASGYDGVAELRFDDLAELETAFTEPRYLAVIRPDEKTFVGRGTATFVAREELIYDLG